VQLKKKRTNQMGKGRASQHCGQEVKDPFIAKPNVFYSHCPAELQVPHTRTGKSASATKKNN
jgi:hypothetical protein